MKLNRMFKRPVRESLGNPSKLRPEVPDGLLKKCNACKSAVFVEDVRKNLYICPHCGNYFRVHAYRRVEMIADEGSFEEWDTGLSSDNPLHYKGYEEKLSGLREKTKLDEAVITGRASIEGRPAVLGICDGRFLMASMGRVVGEKIARAVERATEQRLPFIMFACSGGARMQEGIVSLMQMTKTSAALKRHSDAGLLYISVLTDPTTGGVTASFAMLGDIILAEPNALIGFAGPRVIEQTIGQKLPKGFQRSEFLLEHGFVDRIVARSEQREALAQILCLHDGKTVGQRLNAWAGAAALPPAHGGTGAEGADRGVSCGAQEPAAMERSAETAGTDGRGNAGERKEELSGNAPEKGVQSAGADGTEPGRFWGGRLEARALSEVFGEDRPLEKIDAWEHVMLARDKERPTGKDYIGLLFDHFIELHGDRYFRDDPAVIGGIADFHGIPVTVIAQEKGRGTKENIARNFGMVSPDGYRKSLRLMKQAEKFGRPVICIVDTPGAFCGLEAEERGQGEAIARNLYELSALRVPVLSIVIGEGGSGGALAFATANEVWMMEHAVYSVLSPEGFASILWKDSKRAREAAGVMKLTARDLKKLGIVEHVIREEEPATRENLESQAERLSLAVRAFIQKYGVLEGEELAEQRYRRFRTM